jgi:hypothetical protein
MFRVPLLPALMMVLPALLAAQNAPKSAVPRAADGKPDLTGVWQGASSVPGSWEEANSGLGVGGTGKNPNAVATAPTTDLSGRQPPPYQPWAAKKVLESYNKRAIDDPDALCLPPGVPRTGNIGLFPTQIVQTPTQVIILHEYMNIFRIIPLNAKHPDDLEPAYMGDSVGHWEGDTLVVDVTGFNDKTWLGVAGAFHSEELHITERYTRISKDRINYDVTMEDPKVFTKPWVLHNSMMLREGTRLREYVCAENNLDPAQYQELLKNGVKINRQ